MNRALPWLTALLAVPLLLTLVGCSGRTTERQPSDTGPVEEEGTMGWSLRSTAFSANAEIPDKYTCEGADVSPQLSWTSPPEGTAEIALICSDPDAPSGNWVHWVIYGIAPDRLSLPEAVPTSETLPDLDGARQGRNDFGRIGYGGPCPPPGPAHHYHFRLYALDAPTNLRAGATEAELLRAMKGHIVARGELVGVYSR